MPPPPPQRPHDPFNDAPPRRPISRTTSHLSTTTSLRPTSPAAAAAASTSRNLFAASLSRRPASSTTHNAVLEDSDDHDSNLIRLGGRSRNGSVAAPARTRRARAATETTVELDEEEWDALGPGAGDVVVRDERGGYLREVPMLGEIENEEGEEATNAEEAEDARLNAIVRDFWASGGGMSPQGSRGSRRFDEAELQKAKTDIMARLHDAVADKLASEQWMYEPTDYMEELRIAKHGRL